MKYEIFFFVHSPPKVDWITVFYFIIEKISTPVLLISAVDDTQ